MMMGSSSILLVCLFYATATYSADAFVYCGTLTHITNKRRFLNSSRSQLSVAAPYDDFESTAKLVDAGFEEDKKTQVASNTAISPLEAAIRKVGFILSSKTETIA